MKRIGIDARLIDQTGVGTYIKNLIRYLPPDQDVEYIVYYYDDCPVFNGIATSSRQGETPRNDKFCFKKAPYRWHSIDEQIKFLDQINSDNLDLIHFTYFSFPYFYNKPYVITIHDLTPYFFKTGKASTKNIFTYNIKHFFYKQLIKKAVNSSRNIITPTETVKKQIISTFDINVEKIATTYEGVNNEIIDSNENEKLKTEYGKGFFLYVGNFYPHKNVEILIEAFRKVNNKKLILVGKRDFFSKRIYLLISKYGLADRILIYDTATPSDLKYFYKNAEALIFPSFSEGFGLPIIEAAYLNCPIITSNIEVFKEIVPDNKYFFDPNNVSELVKIISENRIYDKVNINFDVFSFSEMAKKTFAIYKKNL